MKDSNDDPGLIYEENEALERLRRDPNWRPGMDPTYSGPRLTFRNPELGIDYAPRTAPPAFVELYSANTPAPCQPQRIPLPDRSRMAFGERIRDLRRALRWTQLDAAEQLGVSRRSVIRHERNQSQRPHFTLLLRVRELEADYARDLAAYVGRLASRRRAG
jgi:DNA-binding XRE family transcriptional regulator